jgi:staphylococcal nuclease domain-containing protein 1
VGVATVSQLDACLLLLCASQAKRGIHSNKEVQTPRVNDVSTPGNGQRAKQYLPFLQRAGKLLGLVENVSSGE